MNIHDSEASPIKAHADGVAVDHPVHLSGSGLREDWREGDDDEPPDATRR